MRAVAAALGNPQNAFRSALIAGTNGKGSVARLLSAMMPEAGLYTSPHLVRLNERIRIGSEEISDEDLKRLFETVRAAGASTYFEMVTAIAFLYYRDRVNFAVLEVGMGGRLDATSIVHQDVSIITSIGVDHQEFLGSTVEQIAREKAGIIKETEPVVVGPGADLPVVRERAGDRLVRSVDVEKQVVSVGAGYFELDLNTPVRRYQGLRPGLAGRHQLENVIVAIRAAECLNIQADRITRGVNGATWPGRLEKFEGRPSFLLDGAHNAAATRALAAFLEEFYPSVWIIFGAMADKQYEDMIQLLRPYAREFIFTKPESARAKDPAELQKLIPGSHTEISVERAVEYARAHAPGDSTVLICGSLYLIGEARLVLE
jgi:dihydrofolate synthase/folylpolyglutamate synthase